MSKLPFQTTKVPVKKTIDDIHEALTNAEFDEIAIILSTGKNAVMASKDGISFRFEVDNVESIQTKMYCDDAKAQRIAWRILYWQIKASCDLIRWGLMKPIEVFTGQVLLPVNGVPTKLSSSLVKNIIDGKLEPSNINKILMIEE